MVSWTPVQGSSAISAIGLDPSYGNFWAALHVRFVDGRTYVYIIPDLSYFDAFCDASSKGRYYVYVIKARFDYVAKY